MAGWLTSLTSKLTGLIGGKPPSAYVGVFGKHPGWNDHIDDLGLDSEALVAAKEILYVHGIGGVVDSGKWETLPADEPAIPFHHVFVWMDGSNLLFGQLWASSDGKGRTKYPMVICVHLSGRTAAGLPDMTPVLAGLESSCRAATMASEVESLVRRSVPKATELIDAPAPNRVGRAALAGELGLNPEAEGALRIAYAAESYLSSCKNGPAGQIDLQLSKSKLQPQHLRVPAVSKHPLASIIFWRAFCQPFLPAGVPQFYLVSLKAPWLDLIVGPLTPKHLACIRCGGKSVPPASDIPFNISPPDRERAKALWTAFLAES
jgi:hypothetical protein